MLDRRVSATASSSVDAGVDAVLGVDDRGGHPNGLTAHGTPPWMPESLAARIGDTRVSVQRGKGDTQILVRSRDHEFLWQLINSVCTKRL